MPGWEVNPRTVPVVSRHLGPPFYYQDTRSDGLLIKFYKETPVFLIDNGQKHQMHDAYSFENYKYQGKLLEWRDIISATEEIVREEFPTASRITLTPALSRPVNGATLHESSVTLFCQSHPNPSWDYHIQLARDEDFNSLVSDYAVSYPSLFVANLAPGDYFWRMRGVKADRMPSDWSETWSFTVSFPDDPS